MTIGTLGNRFSYPGNGVSIAFAFPALFYASSDLVVLIVNNTTGVPVTQIEGTNYNVTGTGTPSGGSVNFITYTPVVGETVVVYRDPPLVQATDYVEFDDFPAETHEKALDKSVMAHQRTRELVVRTLHFPDADPATSNGVLPGYIERASKFQAYDASGNPIAASGTPLDAVPVTAFMETLLDDPTAAIARGTLDVPATTEVTAFAMTTKGDLITRSSSAVVRKAVGTDGYMLVPNNADTTGLLWTVQGAHLFNGVFGARVSGNQLILEVLTFAGLTPSNTDPVFVAFRDAVGTTGKWIVRTISAACRLDVVDTATLGTLNNVTARLYGVLIDDAGTVRMGVYNPLSGMSVIGIDENSAQIVSTVNGLASDSAQVIYTDTGTIAGKRARTIGYCEIAEVVAGTWATAPTKVHTLRPGDLRTGMLVQEILTATGAVATGATPLPADDTIPQITEGDEYMTTVITPTNVCNVMDIEAQGYYTNGTGVAGCMALFRDAVANALAATSLNLSAVAQRASDHLMFREKAQGVVANTYRLRIGISGAGTTTFNGSGGARLYGGVLSSYLRAREVFV